MTKTKLDVCIIGCGVAGTLASLRIHEKYKSIKTLVIELGKPPGKRRRFLEGFLGLFPNSDGKLFIDDTQQLLEFIDGRSVAAAERFVYRWLEQVGPTKVAPNKLPAASVLKKIDQNDFEFKNLDYIQWKPENIHQLSKLISETTEASKNLNYSFNNEVFKILKKKDGFIISTEEGEIFAKQILLATGRSGWRWATQLYKDLGMEIQNDYATYGVWVEMAASYMKEFNSCCCSIKGNDLEIGPLSWNGTIMPEDHSDAVSSCFRSGDNEKRWDSDKVSFSLMSKKYFKDEGVYQADRVCKLTYLVCNDRIGREKIKTILDKESQISILPEYDWLPEAIETVSKIIPNVKTRGYYLAPNIQNMPAQIRLGSNLESEIDGLFVAGENAGIKGLLGAALSGTLAADSMCK